MNIFVEPDLGSLHGDNFKIDDRSAFIHHEYDMGLCNDCQERRVGAKKTVGEGT